MSESQTSRRWYSWHRSSRIAFACALCLLVVLILYPRSVELPQDRAVHSPDGMYYVGLPINELGWPFAWSRTPAGMQNFVQVKYEPPAAIPPPYQLVSETPPDRRDLVSCELAWPPALILAADVMIAVLLCLLIAGAFEFRRRRRVHVLQFSLFDLGMATLVIATYIGSHRHFAEANYMIEKIEEADGMVSAHWYGPTWLGSLRPVTVTEVVFRRVPTPRMRRQVARWTELRQLEMRVPLEDPPDLSWLSGLTKLEHLDLSNTGVDDEQLAHLGKLKQLRRLLMRSEGGPSFRPIGMVVPKPTTELTSEGFLHLAGLERLECLDLFATPVNDSAIAALGPMPNLRYLELSQTNVSDNCAKSLAGFKNLEYLGVESTQFGPKHAEELAALDKLSAVRIGATPLAKYITREVRSGRWEVLGDRNGLWFQTEVGLWALLLERGHRDYVAHQVSRLYPIPQKRPESLQNPRTPYEAIRLISAALPREQGVPILKRLIAQPRTAQLLPVWDYYNVAITGWAAYGLDDELVTNFRHALRERSWPLMYRALIVCDKQPEYAQALTSELCHLLQVGEPPQKRHAERFRALLPLLYCGDEAHEPVRTHLYSDLKRFSNVCRRLVDKQITSDWTRELLEHFTDHPSASIRRQARETLKQLHGSPETE